MRLLSARLEWAETPKELKGFEEHGVKFVRYVAEHEALGICPACGKEKFYVDAKSRLWDCKRCAVSGNFEKFLATAMQVYRAGLKGEKMVALAKNRGLRPQTLKAWGIGCDIATGRYMIPQNNGGENDPSNIQIYRTSGKNSGHAVSTTGCSLSLFGPMKLHGLKEVWLAEGVWDGMALWEAMRGEADVFAVPGAGTFPKASVPYFTGKDVNVVFDNDLPGRSGSRKSANVLSGTAKTMHFLHWPQEIDLPEGYDVREMYHGFLCNGEELIRVLRERLRSEPPVEIEIHGGNGTHPPPPTAPVKRLRREDVLKEYRKWLHLPNPEALDVLYGSIFANRIGVDPLWLFLVAPPGGSKSELLMSLSAADSIVTTTSITPAALISGAHHAQGDPSLIPKLDGKVLVIKDFTTILSMNESAREEIFGILRDAYDGRIERRLGNGVHRQYESKFGILAGVTPVIEAYASSHGVLGERFLKYRIKQPGNLLTGRDLISRAIENLANEDNMRGEFKAVASNVLLHQPDSVPKLGAEVKSIILSLAQWTACLRGVVSRDRFSRVVAFKPTREIGTRLAKQLAALAMGIAVYWQQDHVSEDILNIIRQVAVDTAPDRAEEIVKQLYIHQPTANATFTSQDIAAWTKLPSGTVNSLMDDMHLLRVINQEGNAYSLTPAMWKLTLDSGLYKDAKLHWGKNHAL
jgi:hypothetical protein